MAQAYSTPSIPPDALHLALYPPAEVSASKAATTALAARLRASIDALLPEGWIWHRDPLELRVERWTQAARAGVQGEHWVVRGGMRVGESIEDEWVGVWLLRELSKLYPDVVASVYDVDGDFLLIEAAQHLPDWVTPQNSENRLLVAQGGLHLLPLDVRSPPGTRPPKHERRATLDDEEDDEGALGGDEAQAWVDEWKAVDIVRSAQGRYRAPEIEQDVWARIVNYPQDLPQHQQRTTLYLPKQIALALARQPALVQKAVEAFYTRDPSQLRRVAKMTHFPPTPDNTVRTQVRMTRTAFAQLEGQEFYPSKAFGPEWTAELGKEGSGEGQERARGVKVAVGFEILVSESKARPLEHPELDSSSESAATRLSHLRNDPEFEAYLATLRRAGWFGEGEIEGSARWKAREEEAARAWVRLRADVDSTQRPSFSTLFEAALSQPGPSSAADLAPTQPDSDVSWLQVDASSLDDLMAVRSGRTPSAPEAAAPKGASAMDIDLSLPADEVDGQEGPDADDGGLGQLAERVGKFVGGKGELEGAVFDDELMDDPSDDDEDDDKLEADMLDDDADESEAETDAAASLSTEERARRMAELVKPLDPGQWGAATQLAPSSSSDSGAPAAAPASTTAAAQAAASSFGVDDAQRARDEVDRQAKLHALGALDAARPPPSAGTAKLRRPLIAKDAFDGVDSDDESSGDEAPAPGEAAGMSAALREAMQRDGLAGAEDLDEDMPQVMEEEGEVDMGDEEGEFLKFAREALGLDESMWEKIVGERQSRGAWLPSKKAAKPEEQTASSSGLMSASLSTKPPASSSTLASASKAVPSPAPAPPPARKDKAKTPSSTKGVSFADLPPLAHTATDAPDFSNASMHMPGPEPDEPLPMRTRREKPREVPEGAVPDPSLNSFEAVMAAMDAHLAQTKAAKAAAAASAAPAPSRPAGKPKAAPPAKAAAPSSSTKPPTAKATPLAKPPPARDALFGSTEKPPLSTPVYDPSDDDDDMGSDGFADLDPDDPLLQMDAELRAALEAAGDLGSDDEDVDELGEEDKVDYGLIKNFLESYKAQGGMAGPVGNLLGRLKEKKDGR